MPRQNEYFDWIDREGLASSREHYDRQYDRIVPPQQEIAVTTKVDSKKVSSLKFEQQYSAAFKEHGNGVQIGVFDLGNIHDAAKVAHQNGDSINDAVVAAIQKYRKN